MQRGAARGLPEGSSVQCAVRPSGINKPEATMAFAIRGSNHPSGVSEINHAATPLSGISAYLSSAYGAFGDCFFYNHVLPLYSALRRCSVQSPTFTLNLRSV